MKTGQNHRSVKMVVGSVLVVSTWSAKLLRAHLPSGAVMKYGNRRKTQLGTIIDTAILLSLQKPSQNTCTKFETRSGSTNFFTGLLTVASSLPFVVVWSRRGRSRGSGEREGQGCVKRLVGLGGRTMLEKRSKPQKIQNFKGFQASATCNTSVLFLQSSVLQKSQHRRM